MKNTPERPDGRDAMRAAPAETLQFDIRSFGPLAHASFELRPLTIFVGANNTGKSTAAVVCRAFFGLVGRGHHRDYYGYGLPQNWWELLGESSRYGLMKARRGGLRAGANAGRTAGRQENPKRERMNLETFCERLPHWVHERLHSAFREELQDRFSRTLQGLVRNPSGEDRRKPADIRIVYGDRFCFGLRIKSDGAVRMTEERLDLREELRKALYRTFPSGYHHAEGVEPEWFAGLPPIDRSAFYLPAARSGLLQSHRLLMQMLVRRAGQVGREPLSVPTLPGSVAGFVDDLLRITPGRRPSFRRRKPLHDIADWISTRTTGGRIVAEPGEEQPDMFEITYTSGESRFGIESVSSSIAEVAPIVLFVRHLVAPGDLLVIEEPEAHLHPENQRELARGIARLVNAGVRVLVTTHSDYLLQQFGNLVRLGALSDPPEGYQRADALREGAVGVYDFCRDPETGTTTREVRVSGEEGIEEEGFHRVTEELYEETVQLDYRAGR